MATLVSLQIPRTGFKITKKFSLEAILLILTISDLQVLSQFMMEWEKDKTPAMLGSKRFFSQHRRWSFAEGVKEFAAQQERFNKMDCGVCLHLFVHVHLFGN